MLEFLLFPRKGFGFVNGTFADDHIRLAIQNRTHQLFDVLAAVLVVCIGVDDNVRTQPQASVQTSHKATCQTLVPPERHDMVKSQFSRPLYRLVPAAVVDDQILNGIDAVNVTGQVIVRQFQCFLLIVTWYLNDQFHILLPFLHISEPLMPLRIPHPATGFPAPVHRPPSHSCPSRVSTGR